MNNKVKKVTKELINEFGKFNENSYLTIENEFITRLSQKGLTNKEEYKVIELYMGY